MNLADLEKRIRRLEISLLQRLATSDRRSVQQATNGVALWVRKLEKLAMVMGDNQNSRPTTIRIPDQRQ